MSKSICAPNFDDISTQSAAELLLLPHCKNGRTPYWNSTSGFDSELFVVKGMALGMGVPNFIQIGQHMAEL